MNQEQFAKHKEHVIEARDEFLCAKGRIAKLEKAMQDRQRTIEALMEDQKIDQESLDDWHLQIRDLASALATVSMTLVLECAIKPIWQDGYQPENINDVRRMEAGVSVA